MTPFDTPSIITYCRSLVAMVPSLVVSDIWFRKYRDLEIRIRGHSKLVPTIQQTGFDILLVFYRTYVPRHTVFAIFTFEKYRELETGVRGTDIPTVCVASFKRQLETVLFVEAYYVRQ